MGAGGGWGPCGSGGRGAAGEKVGEGATVRWCIHHGPLAVLCAASMCCVL